MLNPDEKKRSWNPLTLVLALSGVFGLIFLLMAGLFRFYSDSSPISQASGSSTLLGAGAVGVVEVSGVILDSKKVLAKLDRLAENDRVKAVVVRLNSPGGAVAPSQEIYQAIKDFKKPVVASMGSVAASGAYYIACGAKKVYANPGTLTGSIGVIMEFANLQKLYDWAKIQRYAVKTGKFKNIGAEYREMTPEEKTLLQSLVDDVLSQFTTAVSEGRSLTTEQVKEVADGRIFSGAQAKALHLVDELGTIQDAITEAGRLGQIKGKPAVIYTDKKKISILDFLMDDATHQENGSSGSSRLVGGWVGLKNLDHFFGLLNRAVDPSASMESESSQPVGLAPGLYWLWR